MWSTGESVTEAVCERLGGDRAGEAQGFASAPKEVGFCAAGCFEGLGGIV